MYPEELEPYYKRETRIHAEVGNLVHAFKELELHTIRRFEKAQIDYSTEREYRQRVTFKVFQYVL